MENIEKRREIMRMVKEISIYYEKTKEMMCANYNFSNAQASILVDVYRSGPTRVTDICRRLGKATNTISPMINRLVQNKSLVKKVDENDHRVVTVSLTPEAKEAMENLMHDASNYTWPVFDTLSEEEIDGMYNWLEKIVNLTYKLTVDKES